MATLLNALTALRDSWESWREREQAIAELSALDDRTLADLGLRRSEIPFVVESHARTSRSAPRAGVDASKNNGLRVA
jgi:uncharacterized protein YjiS (DUF1127 family)